MRRIIAIGGMIIMTMLLQACQNVPIWKQSMFERPEGNKEYPPLYIKGWQDGCESGAQASANYMFRWKYKYRQDWQLIQNPQYSSGWEAAYNHCRKYVLQHNLDTMK